MIRTGGLTAQYDHAVSYTSRAVAIPIFEKFNFGIGDSADRAVL